MGRKILYISGTRADFGLMLRTLKALDAQPEVDLGVIMTGMHLSRDHGYTAEEVKASGLRIAGEINVPLKPATGATMARGIGAMIQGFTEILETERPDILLLLGDRGEMLAGAIAAIHLNIIVAHIHGGERSGSVDEPVRHAISKLSHIHLAATEESRARLIAMGEKQEAIHVVGAPGLDALQNLNRESRETVAARYGLSPEKSIALFVFHPVVQESDSAGLQASTLLHAVRSAGCQIIALMPNADAGSDDIRQILDEAEADGGLTIRTHLSRDEFVQAMAGCDLLIGNSSAGIIEAATFGTPVINVGNRQAFRQRNTNVIDVAEVGPDIIEAILSAVSNGRFRPGNVYGDGDSAGRISQLLAHYDLCANLFVKVNSY